MQVFRKCHRLLFPSVARRQEPLLHAEDKPGRLPHNIPERGIKCQGENCHKTATQTGGQTDPEKTPAPCTSRNESVSGFVQIILVAATRWMLELMTLRTRLEPVFDYLPVDICEKCFNVFWPFGRFIVEQERVFPYVHHEHRIISGDIADFV